MKRFFRICSLAMLAAILMALAAGVAPLPLAAQGLAPDPGLLIKLERATFAPAVAEPKLPANLTLSAKAAAGSTYFIVQFHGPITAGQQAALAKQGATVVDYIPDYAYVVRMPAQAAARLNRAALGLNYVGALQPAYKLARTLDDRAALPTVAAGDGRVLLTLTSWPGERAANLAAAVSALGGEVRQSADNELGAVVKIALDPARINDLAFLNGLAWIEPSVAIKLHNDVGRTIMDVPAAQAGVGLYGEGQIVAVADSGLDTGNQATLHPDLRGRLLAGYAWGRPTNPDFPGDPAGDWSDNDGHGTHVAGSVTGDGTMSGANPALDDYAGAHAGSAPKAKLVFQSIAGPDNSLTGIPSDLNLLFQQAYDDGARVHTNSWGSTVAGAYTGDSRQVDQFLWTQKDMYISFSAGNDGTDTDGTLGVIDPGSIGSPATSKNAATVGASENERASGGYNPGSPDCESYACFGYNANPIRDDTPSDDRNGLAAFSSRGPTADGRIKPDFVAPGTNIISTHSQQPRAGLGWGAGPSQWYNYEGGTSMATPLSAGAAVLVRQFFTDVEQRANPSGALIKAALINGAVDMTPGQYTSSPAAFQEVLRRPDRSQGWGRVNVKNAIMPAGPAALWYDDHAAGLATGQVITYTSVFTVGADTSAPLRATLAWADYPGSLISLTKLVNDLDLRVIGPDNTIYYGNDMADGALDGDLDRLNNVEGVAINAPLPGAYTVVVRAHNVPQGPQPYALVISGPQGGVTVNPPRPERHAIAGRSVEYGLTIRNSTTTARSFDVALQGAPAWNTTLSANTTGMLAVGASKVVTATVTVPVGAAAGSSDSATVRVQAAGEASLSDSAVLTTVAVNEGVSLSPASQAKNGAGGAPVRYQFTVTNRSGSSRAFNLAVTGNQWPTVLRDALDQPITATPVLAPDASVEISVVVTPPAGVLIGKRDLATLTATASDNPAIAAQAALTTTVTVGWERQDDLPAAVGEATLISDGAKLHLLGGVGAVFTPSSDHRIYNPTTGAWTTGPALPTPLYSADGCAIGGKLYVPGGRSSSALTAYVGTFLVFDIAGNSWSSLPSVTTVSAGKQPVRYKAVCDPSFGAQGAVYLIGGADRAASLAPLDGVYRFNIGTNSWQVLPALSTPRTNPFGGLINGKIYIAGGQSGVQFTTALSSAEAYDPAGNAWSAQPAMPVATTAGGSAVVGGALYVFGGRKAVDGGTITTGDSYRFDPAAGIWAATPSLNVERLMIAADALDGVIYAAGGNVVGDPTFETFTVGDSKFLTVAASKAAPALVNRGQTFATTITVTATGTIGAPLASLTDTLPLAVDYAGGLSASFGTATYLAGSRTIEWSGALTTSAPLVITYNSTVRADVALGAVFTNAAYINDGEDRAESLVVASARTRVNGPELIYSSKQVEPISAGFSDTVTYTLRMVNSGSTAATATLTDTLPAGLTFGAFVNTNGGAATYDAATRQVRWSGTIQPTAQLEYALRPTTYNWVEISAIGSAISAGQWFANGPYAADDEGYATVTLPWRVPFYGEKLSKIYIDANGQVGFSPFSTITSPFSPAVDGTIPSPGYPNHRVAVRYSDLDLGALTPGGGQVYTYHDQDNNRFIVEFKDIKGYTASNNDAGTSQLIIEPSGRMVLQYQRIGTFIFAGEIGIENKAGTAGLFLETLPASGSAFEVLPPFHGQPEVVFTATINANAPTSGTLTNVAQISDGLGTTGELSAALTLNGAEMNLRKSASAATVPVGGLVTYTLDARNSTPYPGLAQVSDALPAGLEYVAGSLTGGGQYFPVTNTVQWNGQLGVANYTLSSAVNAAAFTDISGSGTPTGLGDEDNELLELPFPFVYYGEIYTRTALVANGYLRMYQGTPPADYVDPNVNVSPLGPSNPDNIIAPFWADLDPTPKQLAPNVDPTIFYQSVGAAPNRRFIVQWNNVPIYGTQVANTFQVVLHESSGAIEFIYKTMGNQGSVATIGLEDANGQRVKQYSNASTSLTNGLVLTWTPTNAELRRLTFQARVVAPAQNGDTLTNTASVSFGERSRQASASFLVGEVAPTEFNLYMPMIKK